MTVDDRSSPATAGRHLLRSVPIGALATVMRETDGAPYASLAPMATDHDGCPILLISDLADHTKNAKLDERVSLLLNGSEGHEDPLAGARLTLQGRLSRPENPELRRRYLARHPAAALYADFGDFGFYRLLVEKAHLVAGFGRIHWIEGAALLIEPPAELAASDADITAHMNDDHQDAIQLYANTLLGLEGDDWIMTGVDAEGVDLRRKERVARLRFDGMVNTSTDVRKELVSLVNKARSA